jgi:hypothetical protein
MMPSTASTLTRTARQAVAKALTGALFGALLTASAAAAAPRSPATVAELPVFEQAAVRERMATVAALLRASDLVGAVVALGDLSRRHPDLMDLHLALAQFFARAGATEPALGQLSAAIDAGLDAADAVAAARDFAAMADSEPFKALLARMRAATPLSPLPPVPPPIPGQIRDHVATIATEASAWSAEAQALVTQFAPEPARPATGTALRGPGASLLNRLVRSGAAAGGRGDFYDNRDDDHSQLPPDASLDIARIVYGPEAKAAGLSRGIKGAHLFGGPTIGNSSTAITAGPLWRSMSRRALTEPGGPDALFRQYRRNQLYVYPEHKDHDPFWGDLFPAQTPYLLTTQGSSWSDKPFLVGLTMALAALKPEVKADLTARGLIAPTLQMLIRRSMEGIETDADYLSPRAHPEVFDAEKLDYERLVRRANALDLATLPPPAVIRVAREMRPTQRIELFGDVYNERYIDTPHAIARIARGAYGERRMSLSATATTDPNGRKLTYHWKVLTGGTTGVEITPTSGDGADVDITVPWQTGLTAPGRDDLRTFRLDVMAVADNGAELGAPAFLSILFPPRTVAEFDGLRPVSMVYDAVSRLDEYQDPVLFPLRQWRDDYSYDDQKRLLGWTRTHADGKVDAFTRHGAMVETRDDRGRPLTARQVAYPSAPADGGAKRIVTVPLEGRLGYEYDGPDDRLGRAAPIPTDG